MMIAHMTKNAKRKNVKIHAWVFYVVAGQNVRQSIIKLFAIALVECKEIHWFPVLKLDVPPTPIVPQTKSVTTYLQAVEGIVNHYVHNHLVLLEHLVML